LNTEVVAKLPRTLTRRRAELAYERQQLKDRLSVVERELESLDYSLRVVSPSWMPPKRVTPPAKPTLLPRGAVARGCLQLLRQREELATPELASLIAANHQLAFASRRAEEDFASSVAVALRRHERAGLVRAVSKDDRTGALRWRLNTGTDGRLAIVRG
jgi:hypothetical protein